MADDFAKRDAEDNPDWTVVPTGPLDTSAKLRVLRVRLGMSQRDFAALLDIPLSTLQNWEQRRTEPDPIAKTLIDLIFDDPEGIRDRLNKRRAA